MSTAAIVVAGGRGSRLGGVSKADLVVDGERLVDRVLAAVSTCAPRIVVTTRAGDLPSDVLVVGEDPPFSGPASAVAAGAGVLVTGDDQPDWVILCACDLPGVAEAVHGLLEAVHDGVPDTIDALWADANDDDRIQWLISVVRTQALVDAIAALGTDGTVDASMGRLLGGLRWRPVDVPDGSTDDIDTWDDHARWTLETT